MFGCTRGPSDCSVAPLVLRHVRLHFGFSRCSVALWVLQSSKNGLGLIWTKNVKINEGHYKKIVHFLTPIQTKNFSFPESSSSWCSVARRVHPDVRLPVGTFWMFGCISVSPTCWLSPDCFLRSSRDFWAFTPPLSNPQTYINEPKVQPNKIGRPRGATEQLRLFS